MHRRSNTYWKQNSIKTNGIQGYYSSRLESRKKSADLIILRRSFFTHSRTFDFRIFFTYNSFTIPFSYNSSSFFGSINRLKLFIGALLFSF
nr:hypothetical protein Iba_chr08cCG7490 [Ipomoea batatas]